MSNPPRRPPGPPPARPPPLENDKIIKQTIDPKRPPGPPPNAPPLNHIKPPPMAPPPRTLTQNYQRPAVESSIGKRPAAEDKGIQLSQPKPTPSSFVSTQQHKAGAIAMFEEPDEKVSGNLVSKMGPPRGPPPRPQAPSADPTAPMVRMPRALPPRSNPPGIPEGQPLPPTNKPEKEARAPPPVRPPPKTAGGNRAPPKEDPKDVLERGGVVPPPDSEPPLLRVKKKRVEAVVKRREKDMPEFESSDEDEEDPNFVKQPLPFGVLKQPIPVSSVDNNKKQPPPPPLTSLVPAADRKDSKSVGRPGDEDSRLSKGFDDHTPSVAPADNKLTAFVPPAPAVNIDKHFDDSNLGKTLTRGRLSIKCIEGFDIRRKDDQDKIPRNDPFIKFRLGVVERHPWKSTETRRKQNSNPNFENEVVFFDVVDPLQYIFQEDLQICIELWNKSTLRNDLIGSVTMSVVRFFKKPFVSYLEKVPVYYPGMTRTLMKLQLEFVFEEARSGLVQVTLYEGRGLRSIDPMGRQDPYVQLSLGKHYKKRSKSVKNGGVSPYFNEEDLLLWLDQENWVDDLLVEVLDEDAKEDKPIGSTHFSLLPYMKQVADEAKEDSFDLFYFVSLDPKDDSEKKEVACGNIIMRVRFLPSGRLTVYLERAKDLQFPEIHKPAADDAVRIDPYVNLTLEGKAVKMIKRTAADKDGGHDPVWEDSIGFDVVDQYLLDLEVLNQNIHNKDVSMGGTQISLLNVFRNGSMEFWTSLKQKKANGGIKEVGAIFVKLTFTGPIGVSFPQFRPEVDSFDDTLRKLPHEQQLTIKNAEESLESRPLISTIPDENEVPLAEAARLAAEKQERMRSENTPAEFTDDEIIAAFKFIDLDHNNFVGAAEIRHILVCMGEMITDEEIDMMISMVDLDGDGQVSYKEFRSLVLHPNPGVVDMHKEINNDKDNELMREKQAMAGKSQGLDLNAFQRQKEMTQREQKKKMIISFVADNEVNFDYIKQSHLEYLELPKEKRSNGRIKFGEFCKVMRIEPITEYKHLHAFYDTEEMGDMDLREFLLSMLNFVEIDKETRIRFSFTMFDETKSGYISQREVEEILRGNHMISLSSVQRKAETIMKQANSTKTGAITINEFVVVSKKFPNILFPSIGYTPATQHAPAVLA